MSRLSIILSVLAIALPVGLVAYLTMAHGLAQRDRSLADWLLISWPVALFGLTGLINFFIDKWRDYLKQQEERMQRMEQELKKIAAALERNGQ